MKYRLDKNENKLSILAFGCMRFTQKNGRIDLDKAEKEIMTAYNYLDENSQAGRKGLRYASSKELPVMIMEPLRGGRLVNNLPEKAHKLFNEYENVRQQNGLLDGYGINQK